MKVSALHLICFANRPLWCLTQFSPRGLVKTLRIVCSLENRIDIQTKVLEFYAEIANDYSCQKLKPWISVITYLYRFGSSKKREGFQPMFGLFESELGPSVHPYYRESCNRLSRDLPGCFREGLYEVHWA